MSRLQQIIFCFLFLLLITVSSSPAQNQPETHLPIQEFSIPCGPSFFKLDSIPVTEDEAACLDEVKLRLIMNPTLSVIIDAHRHSKERKGISLTRAYLARHYLNETGGIPVARITIRNFSDTCPYETGDPEFNSRNVFWYVNEQINITHINKAITCAEGHEPHIVTTEKPIKYRRHRLSWY